MYKEVLRAIEGIELFPVIALILFFSFFIGMCIWVWRKDKSYMKEMAAMPLESAEMPSIVVPLNRGK